VTEPTRRFYKTAAAIERDGGFVVSLDQRTLRTPKGALLIAPTRALAEAIAQEWSAQDEHIRPATMPVTQLAFVAIDTPAERRATLAQDLAKYAETDLVCHRADAPEALVERQSAAWDPIVAWAEQRFQIPLPVVAGVIPAGVPQQHLAVLEREIGALDDFRRTALAQAISLAGSAMIGFALLEGRIDAGQAYAAAALDEEWSLERWGEDEEARARLDRLRANLDAVGRFVAALT
jgi:chaperone required for assembly of F1-ATPase